MAATDFRCRLQLRRSPGGRPDACDHRRSHRSRSKRKSPVAQQSSPRIRASDFENGGRSRRQNHRARAEHHSRMKPKIKITLDAECIAKLQRGEVELVEHETAILEFHWKGT